MSKSIGVVVVPPVSAVIAGATAGAEAGIDPGVGDGVAIDGAAGAVVLAVGEGDLRP